MFRVLFFLILLLLALLGVVHVYFLVLLYLFLVFDWRFLFVRILYSLHFLLGCSCWFCLLLFLTAPAFFLVAFVVWQVVSAFSASAIFINCFCFLEFCFSIAGVILFGLSLIWNNCMVVGPNLIFRCLFLFLLSSLYFLLFLESKYHVVYCFLVQGLASSSAFVSFFGSGPLCPACRTTLVATRFRVAVICPIIQVPHCIRVFFYFVWFVFINHIFQFYYELCTYCNILDIYLS